MYVPVGLVPYKLTKCDKARYYTDAVADINYRIEI